VYGLSIAAVNASLGEHWLCWDSQHTCVCDAAGLDSLSLSAPAAGEVDGLSDATVDAWFEEADHNGDGRLEGDEAKGFFQRTSLPVQALSKVLHGLLALR